MAAISAAIAACAHAGELGEAEALVDFARAFAEDCVVADPAAIDDDVDSNVGAGAPEGTGGSTWFGLDEKSCLALARAYEKAGRLADAEGLRVRLQRLLADSLGLERGPGGAGGKEGALPSVGRRVRVDNGCHPEGEGGRRRRGLGEGEDRGEEEERDGELEEGEKAYRHAVDVSDEYDLFLEWMAVDEVEEEAGEERGGALWDAESEGGGGAGALPGLPAVERMGWDVTIRELEGW